MPNFKIKKGIATALCLIFFMTLASLANSPVESQQTTTYTNMQEGGSVPLPSGVTANLTLDTIPHMSFRPNPVGVGQNVLINLWIQPPLHVARYFKDAFKVTMTAPDGTQTSKTTSSYRADSTAWMEFAPDKVGNWTLKFDFLGAYFPAGNYTIYQGAFFYDPNNPVVNFPTSVYYKPSSYEAKLIVQQEQVPGWPISPLPTDYWTRPVSPENREWWQVLGNYPSTGFVGGGELWPNDTNIYSGCNTYSYAYTPYAQAPNSAHIVWKRVGAFGGLYGPGFGQDSMTSGGGTPSIIYQGRCYQSLTKVAQVNVNGIYYDQPTTVWQCYDLRTGEVYWEQTGVPAAQWIIYEPGWAEVPGGDPSFGRNAYLATIQNLGGTAGGRLIKYNPYTGAVAQNISIAPFTSGTYWGCSDNAYFYSVQNIGNITNPNYRLINWTAHGDAGPSGSTINLSLRVVTNTSWPWASLGTVDYEAGYAVSTLGITNPATGQGTASVSMDTWIMGARLSDGQLLYNKSTGVGWGTFPASCADHGKFAARFNDGHWHCFDMATGSQVWTSEDTTFPWGTFGCYGSQSYGGMLISNQYDGVAAFDWNTGKLSWFYQYKVQYPYENPYEDNYPWFTGVGQIADGKLYTYNTEHTTTQPVTRDWRMHCINITTGEPIWSIDGSMSPGALADGYLTASNTYDGYMYIFGKGKSATTVTAPDKAINLGESLVIKGTVLDQSPAAPGTPCVSDESMSDWMAYLHLQRPMPNNATGVPVTLDVLDANGNYRTIDTLTTDASGTFSYMWQPDIPGKYTIIATFAGTESYGSSWAQTAFGVTESTATPATQQVISLPPTELYFALSTAAIIVAIAIVGAVLLTTLRKRA